MCTQNKTISGSTVKWRWSGPSKLYGCSKPNYCVGTAFLSSLIPPLLLLPKSLSSWGCSVSLKHQPAQKKLISITLPPSRRIMVSKFYWKELCDSSVRGIGWGNKSLKDPPHGSVEEGTRNEQLIAKKHCKTRKLWRGTGIKKGKDCGEKSAEEVIVFYLLGAMQLVSLIWLVLSVWKKIVFELKSSACVTTRETCKTMGTVLDGFIRSAWDHTTRQESSQMPMLWGPPRDSAEAQGKYCLL